MMSAATPPLPDAVDPSAAPVPAINQSPLTVEITANQKLIVDGEEIPFEKLKEMLQTRDETGSKPRVDLILGQAGRGGELEKQVTDLLTNLQFAFEVKAN